MAVRATRRSGSPSIAKAPGPPFNAVKVFSATMFAQRERLGGEVTAWLTANPHATITDIIVTQSSDEAYHCLSFSVFYSTD